MYFQQYEQIERLVRSLATFKAESKKMVKYLSQYGIALNFAGYIELIEAIAEMDEGDFESVFNVCGGILLWREYLGSLYERVCTQVHTCENKVLYLEAFIEPERINKKLDTVIQEERAHYNMVKNYADVVLEQLKMLRKIYKFTQYRYEELCKEGMRQA